jgi:Na+/H+-dicarboxylate symporter/ABC-type amino acid transport substrate-binding protein
LKNPLLLWSGWSLSARILVGLGCGLFAGLFFGEPAAILQPVADVYIRLMQMTVLPYLITSLVIAFGQLSLAEARRLALRGGGLLLVVWLISSVIVMAFPLSFPDFVSASFFSQSMIEPQPPLSFTDIYFTSNPFDSLSRNVVPAVVLFSCMVGIGLIGLKEKEQLLAPMRVWNAAIVRITYFVINLTPLGVFAIGAVTAGTITPAMLGRLEVYLIVFAAASLLLTFWILPLLVTAVTPFRYSEVTGIARDALLTAFVANSAFIVLPLLTDRCKLLLTRHGLLDERSESATEVMIPVMFNFPNAGKLLVLLFVPFAAWLSGVPLAGSDYPALVAVGIPSFFAKAQAALPFLIDVFGLPQDLFQLYIPTTILTGKFDSLVTAMNLVVFALVGAAAMGGFIVLQRARVLRALLGIAAGVLVTVFVVGLLLSAVVDTSYSMDQTVREMQNPVRHGETIVHRGIADLAGEPDVGAATLDLIRERGSLRIGYHPLNLPMSFFNNRDELVGFDVMLGEQMAAALGLRAEFVPIEWPKLPGLLERGVIDVMPGMWYRPYWYGSLQLSRPYFTGTIGVAVRDYRRREFNEIAKLRQNRGLKVGVPLDTTQIETSMERYFRGSDVEFVVVEFWESYFEGSHPELDAFLMPAEHASGWTLLYPHYTVVVPQPNPVRVPSAFGVALGAQPLLSLVNEWIIFADNAGLINEAYDYWVLGQGAEDVEPRWSILRDVLGRGD